MAPSEPDDSVDNFPVPPKPAGKRVSALYILGGGLIFLTALLVLAY